MAIASSSSSLISTFFFHSSSFPRSIITKSKSLHFHSPTHSISHPTLFLLHPPPSPPQTPSTKTPLSLPNLSTPKTCLDSIFIFCTSIALSFTLFISNPDSASAFVVTTPRKLQTDELATVRLFQENTPSVVYITNLAVKQDAFTLDVLEVPQGSGSGFVWDKDAHIVTNYHVIRGASDLRVTLADQSTFHAKVVGFDQDKDVAVLRIDAPKDKLRPIPVGVSADLLVDQKVYAIGNPFGLDHAPCHRKLPFQ